MQAYAPRTVTWLGIERAGDWRIKRYAIVYGEAALDAQRFAHGHVLALAELPDPAASDARPGVALEILHQGRTADYLVLAWWDNENELPLRVFVRAGADGWRPAGGSESICVWDLEVLWAERNAYVRTVLGGRPDVGAYLTPAAGSPA